MAAIVKTFTTTGQSDSVRVTKGNFDITFASTGSCAFQKKSGDTWRTVGTYTTSTVGQAYDFGVPTEVRFDCTDATGNVTVDLRGQG